MSIHTLLITPPFTQFNTAYPATAYIKGFLESKQVKATQMDLSIELFTAVFTKEFIHAIFKQADMLGNKDFPLVYQQKQQYINKVDSVMNYLRAQKELPENTDKIFVVSSDDLYVGELLITTIITSDPSLTVREVMDTSIIPIDASEDDKEVATLFERNDLISSAVVDHKNKLIGRITIDDVVDVIREDADQNFLGMAGIAEDTFQPPGRAAKSRVFWLSMNLLTAFLAAMTINIFQDVIDKIVFVAVLMPIVASMGGVAATQTLTIVLRGLTLEQINSSNLSWLFKRELAVAILNGFVLAILIGFSTFFWFGDSTLALLIAAALIINLISSVVAGIFVPLILRKFEQDPAIAGSVVVTTVTDVVGFVSFLGLATIFLL